MTLTVTFKTFIWLDHHHTVVHIVSIEEQWNLVKTKRLGESESLLPDVRRKRAVAISEWLSFEQNVILKDFIFTSGFHSKFHFMYSNCTRISLSFSG